MPTGVPLHRRYHPTTAVNPSKVRHGSDRSGGNRGYARNVGQRLSHSAIEVDESIVSSTIQPDGQCGLQKLYNRSRVTRHGLPSDVVRLFADHNLRQLYPTMSDCDFILLHDLPVRLPWFVRGSSKIVLDPFPRVGLIYMVSISLGNRWRCVTPFRYTTISATMTEDHTAALGYVSRTFRPSPFHLQPRRDPPPRINAISVELLSLILHFAAGDNKDETDPLRVHDQNLSVTRLTAVCSHWRQVAIGDGTLWRNISFSPSLPSTINCAAEFLQRSRGASLTLMTWNPDTPDPSGTVCSQEMNNLLDRLGQNSHRVTALVAINPPDVVIEALSRPAPRLIRLNIQVAQSKEIPQVFGGVMPNLEYLSISNPKGWKIQPFQNIHTVHIVAHSWKLWHLGTLLDFLEAHVPIEELHLTCLEHFESEPATESRRTVSLSSLNVLRLTFCNSALILSHLEISPSTALSIYGYCGRSEDILTGLPESLGPLRIPKTSQLTAIFDVQKQVFEIEVLWTDGLDLLLGVVPRQGQFDRKWVLRSMNAVTRFTPLASAKWLTVVIDEDRMPWKSWLSKFAGLFTLEVRCPDPGELLNALTASSGSTGKVLCPSLRSLSIERNKRPTMDTSLLRRCLETRASAGSVLATLNLNDLDWSAISDTELDAWEELTDRTRLNSRWNLTPFHQSSPTYLIVTIGALVGRDDLFLDL